MGRACPRGRPARGPQPPDGTSAPIREPAPLNPAVKLFNSVLKRTKLYKSLNEDLDTIKSILAQQGIRQTLQDGSVFSLPNATEDLIQKRIFFTKTYYELNVLTTLQSLIPPQARIVDVGANIGNHSVFFARQCGAASIHAFEALESTFQILQQNIALNGLSDIITPHNLALSNAVGRAAVAHHSQHNIGSTSLEAREQGTIETGTLDGFNLPGIDFLKIDVEGFELNVLEGAERSIARSKPLIAIETFGDQLPRVEAFLGAFGYTCTHRLESQNYVFAADADRP
ncbi:MAG: FkbM family methyltransferase [Pseudomonadota bacterium]